MLSTVVENPLAQEDHNGGFDGLLDGGPIGSNKEKGFTPFDEASDLVPDEIASTPELEELFAGQDFGSELFDVTKREFKKNEEEADEFGDHELAQDFSEKTNDPVRMYLREMGTVPLLTREGEIELARRIERGQKGVRKVLSRSPVVVQEVLLLPELVENGTIVLRDILNLPDLLLTDEAVDEHRKRFWNRLMRSTVISAKPSNSVKSCWQCRVASNPSNTAVFAGVWRG